jgi:hypothetical protein
LLHNQSALRLKTRLLFTPGVMVASVPYHLNSSHNLVTSRALSSSPPMNERQAATTDDVNRKVKTSP